MSHPVFAANWKMHLGPAGARQFLEAFLARCPVQSDREIWFFPPAISLEAVAALVEGRSDVKVGTQNVYWEPEGAFTGELSVPMAREAGAVAALVGHSERRHGFGESDEETGRKVAALLQHGLTPMLCVGETIAQREAGETLSVVQRQLGVLRDHDAPTLEGMLIAYEPVWAIGTGKTATPGDAAQVHTFIRTWLVDRGATGAETRILYGGSVKPANVESLMREPEIDGVLVGGASLDPESWSQIVQTKFD